MLQPRYININSKILAGKKVSMSLINNKTGLLWQNFMQQRQQLRAANNLLYSLQVYNADYFTAFNPTNEFIKWALAEVNDEADLPEGFELFQLPGGLYAVFDHKGKGTDIFQRIFTEWLPQSDYTLDDRPHFELLGEKYNNNSDDSEEEIWIPVKQK